MPELDHVIWAVPDIGAAAEALLRGHGLNALEGGVHPAWGTRNAIVPLGGAYLELVEVFDDEAPRVGFTGRVAAVADAGGGPALWCQRVPDIEAEAARRGYDVVPGERRNADGSLLSWRTAGLPQACATPATPFIIEWDDPAAMPGRLAVWHGCGPVRCVRAVVGPDGPEAVVITARSGDRVLRASP